MKLLRKIWWHLRVHSLVVAAVQRNSILIGYPTTIWVDLGGGKEIFFERGTEAFLTALELKMNEISNRLVESLIPDELKPIERRFRSKSMTITRRREHQAEEDRRSGIAIRQMEEIPVEEVTL